MAGGLLSVCGCGLLPHRSVLHHRSQVRVQHQHAVVHAGHWIRPESVDGSDGHVLQAQERRREDSVRDVRFLFPGGSHGSSSRG